MLGQPSRLQRLRLLGRIPSELDDPYYLLWEQTIAVMAMAGIRFNVIEPVDFGCYRV